MSKLTKGQGRWAKKSEKSWKSGKVKPGQGGGGGTGVGDHFGTIRHISINIDRTLPKLSFYIFLMMPYNPTKFQVKTHQGAGLVGKKVLKIQKKSWKSEQGPGTSVTEDWGRARPYNHRTTEP